MVDGTLQFDGSKTYKDSKLCNILFTRFAAQKYSHLTIVSFNPGFIPSTGLFDSLRDENWAKAHTLMFLVWLGGFSVPVSVEGDRLVAIVHRTGLKSGSYYSADVGSTAIETGFGERPVSKEASSDDVAKMLWEKSLRIMANHPEVK
eukprot:CAMPEP_0202475630 /NCGR_PEP_ID=MMETSP1360-20130828/93006_1 /ASSEMBLY_ACC=CAM_ASM_000848 /TAXON_ID=515479 /ORGANISM="Licmophora paradoxa, Strain CCMP2313" /LENGTH=146 /DNA_ID=CAMNT_0049102809 /DNA_START=1302 /DNA_END=1742 /DNA_ORIENTATION=-